jgi:hypothetical protein
MDLGKSLRWREEEIGLLLDMNGAAVPGRLVVHARACIRHISRNGRAEGKYRSRQQQHPAQHGSAPNHHSEDSSTFERIEC